MAAWIICALTEISLAEITQCPTNRTVVVTGACQYVLKDLTGEVQTSDPSAVVSITQSPAKTTKLSPGTTPVTFTVTETGGQVFTCTTLITVMDLTAPTITCQPGKVVQCTDAWTFDTPVASDKCGATTLTVLNTVTNPPSGNSYLATRTWRATDVSGNFSDCSQTVTVIDTNRPVITVFPTNRSMGTGAGCVLSLPDLTGEVVAVDNCGGVVVSQSPAVGTQLSLGQHLVTFTVRDSFSNSTNCSLTLTVVDLTPPVVTGFPTNRALAAGANCLLALPDFAGELGVTDACGAVVVRQSPAPGTMVGLGEQLVSLTATDTSANSTNCSFTLTVIDLTAPTITCSPDKLVQCSAGWGFDTPSATDACGTAVVTVLSTVTNPPSGNSYLATRMWRATDASGNFSDCSQTVTVIDTNAPVITVFPTNRSMSVGVGCTLVLPDLTAEVAADDCSAVVVSQSPQAGTELALGEHLVTFTVRDSFSNTTHCSLTLTAIDLTPPVLTGSADKTVSYASAWAFDEPSASDACGTNAITVVSTGTNATCGAGYLATRVWQAMDAVGNSSMWTQAVTVVDSTPPVLVCPSNFTVACASAWDFGTPVAADKGLGSVVVFDNTKNDLGVRFDPGTSELGSEVLLAGEERYLQGFSYEFWSTNLTGSAAYEGTNVTVRLRFYANDGAEFNGYASPGTLLYDSGDFALGAYTTARSTVVYDEYDLWLYGLAPLTGALPDRFTWTVQFGGLGDNDRAGVDLFSPPVVGQTYGDYWLRTDTGWQLRTNPEVRVDLAAQARAGSNQVIITVVGTVTNATEGSGYVATRTWLATDACGNTSSCAQSVTVDAVRAEASFTTIACHGGSSVVTVTATGGTGPYTGTGEFAALAGPHSYMVTDAKGCSSTATVDIPEPAAALVASAGPGKEIYAGTSALIGGSPTATGGVAGYTYQWSPTHGLNDPTLPKCTATPEVTTDYTVTVTDANGCTASASVTVTVGPAPPHEPLGPSSRKTPVIFSEIMYKPAPRQDANNLEFIEIYNSNPWFEDIGGYRIVGDNMNYTFPAGTTLPGGGFLVVAASPSSLRAVYGITNVVGPYTGSLKKSGTLELLSEQGAVLLSVEYSNVYPWPVAATGTGHSIILANPTYGEGDPRAWAISDSFGGSPGKIDTFHPSPLREVMINEVLAHSEDPAVQQFIELYNHATGTNDLSGCILTDDPLTNKFIIPANTLIEPGGFISFNETQLGFGLNGGGGTVYLIKADGSCILDALQFEAQADGVSLGRWPDGAPAIYSLASRTPGTNNSDLLVGDIVINELMYHPISENDDDQYIELYNQGTNPVSLANWKFTAGITFTFPADTTLAPNGYLVVARNLTNLLARYPNLNSGNALGNYGGKLSHKGERVALAMPQPLTGGYGPTALNTNLIYVVEDEVTYGTAGRWGRWTDGGGSSLELIDPRANHRLAANWTDSDETQKSAWTNIETTGVLDHGQYYEAGIVHAQIGLLDVGECLVDEVEVRAGTDGPNLVTNPDFETSLEGWSLQGDHSRSSLESPGYAGSYALRMRASDQIWTGVNSCQLALNSNALAEGQTATLRFKARWLRGWPELLLRLNGNWLEATGRLPVPPDLGTPGAPNSLLVNNAGPAVYDVRHTPTIPAADEAVVVTARAHDPDGVRNLVLHYRLDPATSYTTAAMNDEGIGGDVIPGDGVFSAAIPGQSSNSIVAFYLTAEDTQGATTRFPALLNDNSLERECVVRFGDENAAGSFGAYHLWITETNKTRWTQMSLLSNEPHDCTFVSGTRVIYNSQGQFQGSPFKQFVLSTPDGPLCNYKWVFPDDDQFLGATSFNPLHQPGNAPGDDPSLQREQTANTFLRALGEPWLYRRYVAVYVNGSRRGMVMEDAQRPNGDLVKEYFPADSDGWLYKMQMWDEFAPEANSLNVWDFIDGGACSLMPYTTTGGLKKTARYRWIFTPKRTPDSANNFTNVFALVDAAGSYGTPEYVANMEKLADMENWMRVFAANHAAGNWDAYGALNAQNMYGYVGPLGTKYTLLNYDFNIVLGNPVYAWGPGEHLFDVSPQDPNTANFYQEPTFRRMYWRALKELVDGPLDPVNSGPLLDARYEAFVANGFSVEDPGTGIKPWMSAARASIASQIAAEDTTNFTANLSTVVSNDVAYVSGTAPVDAKTIWFNGTEWPITWTSVTNWTARVPLAPGTNQFTVAGVDRRGQTIAGYLDSVTAVSEHQAPPIAFIPYDLAGLVYTQDFNGLPNPGAQSVNTGNPVTINGITYSLANPFGFAFPVIATGNAGGLGIASLAGWYGMADPTASVGARFGATSGDQTTGGVLSFGLPNGTNRAVGLLATSSTGFTAFGAKFVNRTDRTLTRMTLQYTGEVWRQSNLPKTLLFYYLIDPTAAAEFSTSYTDLIPGLNVDFPTVATAVGGVAVDGTSSLNQTNLGVVNYAIDWPPGAALWLGWEMVDPAGKSQGLGIDNLSFSASDQAMIAPVRLTITPEGTNVTFSWPTLVGQAYQPEYNEDLATTNWTPLGTPVDGTGGVVALTNNMATSHRFFRLRLLLP